MVNDPKIERARKLADVMITRAHAYDDAPKLFDLANADPAALLSAYESKLKNFDTAPFDPAGDSIRFYDGGYTIWSGYPGNGKTTLLRQLACHLIARGKSMFVAHLEEDPGDSLIRTAGVAFGTNLPSVNQLQWFLDFNADALRVWGVIGLCPHRELFGTIQDLASKGVKHFIIDSLMCLDLKSDDYEAQRVFANGLSALARNNKIHIHLVAHPRKVQSAEQDPDLNDIAGSADLGRLADNVLFIRRGTAQAVLPGVTPMQIMIKKQRYDPAFHGNVNGYYNRNIRQFCTDQWQATPTQYLPKEAYEEMP
ncbi:AAA domain containing protein [uncultured Caudovirales phage]|uniref:AAA domain containing protein n=1 Tax=uncultured Caudovirales phage TaxID=2100421 RepID=A0A6J5TBC1_9CAUD|nr:AAA domain containing protein [uncultured Caudovirales phage]